MGDVKKFLPILVAGALGLIAVFLINAYLKQQAQQAREAVISTQKNITTVVVAKQDISANTVLTEQMLAEKNVSRDRLQPRAAVSIDRAVGKVTMAPIAKDEQILLNKLVLTGQEISLSAKVPPGKRAITIPVDNISSVGGMIRPGDHVDVMGLIPVPAIGADGKPAQQLNAVPLFQDVLILAVGQEFSAASGEKKGEKTASSAITLALTPQEANLIAFLQEQQGKIRLILRSPGDTKVDQASKVRAGWDTVLNTVMPEIFQQQAQPQDRVETAQAAPKKTVEIYRGMKKEVKPLE